MSIEKDLTRIADALEKLVAIQQSEPAPAKPSKPAKPAKADKPAKQEDKPAVVADNEAYPVPTNEAELIALMSEKTKGLAPEKMIQLGKLMSEKFKVKKLHDLPDEDYEDFAIELQKVVQG